MRNYDFDFEPLSSSGEEPSSARVWQTHGALAAIRYFLMSLLHSTRHHLRWFALLPFLLGGVIPTLAAPANDAFANASGLTGLVVTTNGVLLGATLETAEPAHGDPASVWFRWTAPRTGRVRVACDEHLSVYTGLQLSTLLRVSRPAPYDHFLGEVAVFEATANKVYYVAVTGSAGAGNPFLLRLDYTPVNDDFAAALPLSGTSNRVFGSTIGGSWEVGEPGQNLTMSGNSVWWTYTAPFHGRLEITNASPTPWPVMWIYEGNSVSNLTWLGGNHVPRTASPLVTCHFAHDVRAGQSYRIAATGHETNFVFDLRLRPPPPNDSFAAPFSLDPAARIASARRSAPRGSPRNRESVRTRFGGRGRPRSRGR
jgi:hypothetical protein